MTQAFQQYVPRAGNLDPVGDNLPIPAARQAGLWFIPSAGNPTLAGAGEPSYVMDGDGVRVHRWVRFVGQADFYHYTAANVAAAVSNTWSSATQVTGLNGGIGLFPYVRRYSADGKFYLAYVNAARTALYLANSTDGNAFTTVNGGNPVLSRTNDPTDYRYLFGNPSFAFQGSTIHWMIETSAQPSSDGGGGTAFHSYSSVLAYGRSTVAAPAFTLPAGDDGYALMDGAAAQLEYSSERDALVCLYCDTRDGFTNSPYGYFRVRGATAKLSGGANDLTRRAAWQLGDVLIGADESVATNATLGTTRTQRSDPELLIFPASSGGYRGLFAYNWAQTTLYTELMPDGCGVTSWADVYDRLTFTGPRPPPPASAGLRLVPAEPQSIQAERQPRRFAGPVNFAGPFAKFSTPVRGLPTATTGSAHKAPGTNYAATGSYADSGLEITLPGAGTFRITACVYVYTVVNVQGTLRLWNATDAVQIGTAKGGGLTNTGDNGSMVTLIADVTVTAAKTIRVQAIGVGMTVQSGNPPGDPSVSEIFYAKLSD